MPLASTGKPGRIGNVQIDVIEGITAPRTYDRTDATLETGAPVSLHRRRVPFTLTLSVLVTDVEPVAGARLLGLWEKDHARKTKEAIEAIQASGEAVEVYDGKDFLRTPTGKRVWIIDALDPTTNVLEEGVWRATISLGELPRASTAFTAIDPDVDPDAQDLTDGYVDKGQQSTEDVPADIAAQIALT